MKILEHLGFDVLTAEDGVSALEIRDALAGLAHQDRWARLIARSSAVSSSAPVSWA